MFHGPPVRTLEVRKFDDSPGFQRNGLTFLITRVRYPTYAPNPPCTFMSIPTEYNVGLALLRLGKVMPASGPDGSANPAVDCCVLDGAGQGEAELPRRCLPLTPPWWPVDLDPATGKVPA